jgi:hypothetical protein
MKRSTPIFDDPPWWQRPGWQVASAVVLTVIALPIWWAALAPAEPEPVAQPAAPQPATVARAVPPANTSPTALPTAPSPQATQHAPEPPLSTMVEPGVHVTPLSVPPGTRPMPAGPSEDDSEPEN